MHSPQEPSPPPFLFRTASYDYALPEDLVAQEPAEEREHARMLLVPRRGPHAFRDGTVPDLVQWLRPGDLMVLNETRVVRARLAGTRAATDGRAEILLLARDRGRLRVLLGTRGKPRPGEVLTFSSGALEITLEKPAGEGVWIARTDLDDAAVDSVLASHGKVPLPPYIRRKPDDARESMDRDRYQTVYARHAGAVAAPTAGLHLSDALIRTLEDRGVTRTAVTLHVGPGTFRPVTAPDLRHHPMHEERYEVPAAAAEAIRTCRARGGRIVPVGTTVVRVLESAGTPEGHLQAGPGRTRLFLHPPSTLRFADALITNFHAPRSTLLMLVAAFAGRERILAAYRHAIRRRYRLLSYGDAMLIA